MADDYSLDQTLHNESMESMYNSLTEDSVFRKRHETSAVLGDGLCDQINERIMQMHMELVYKNLDKENDRSLSNFSFEIDQTNNMVIPNNLEQPMNQLNFV